MHSTSIFGRLPSCFPLSYWMSGLYSRPALSQPEDLQRGTACSFCILLTYLAFALAMRPGWRHFTPTFAICVVTNAILMPLLRELSPASVRRITQLGRPGGHFWCGARDARTDSKKPARARGRYSSGRHHRSNPAVPVLSGVDCPSLTSIAAATQYIDRSVPAYGLLTPAAASSAEISRLVRSSESAVFSRIVIVSNPSAMASMWAIPLERRAASRLNTSSRINSFTYHFAKRLIDLGLGIPVLLACAPFMLLVAVLIKLDSPGPVFFGHQRIGRNGRTFIAWKFRTMHANSKRHPGEIAR